MLIPKYEIGQKVFAVNSTCNTEEVHIECDACNSTGKVRIIGKDGEYECPVCRGAMELRRDGYKYDIAYSRATIGKIQTEEYSKKYRSYKSRITYMLQESGVGGGCIWREDRLFATEAEAIEFCSKYVPSDYYDTEAIPKA